MAIRAPSRPHLARRLLTLEEFLELPETKPASELIDGEVVQKPMPKIEHSRPHLRLANLLQTHPATRDGETCIELGIPLTRPGAPGNLRVPDVSWYQPSVALPDEGYPDAFPTLAVEVRSRGQSKPFLQANLSFQREHGARSTMLIDPGDRTVEVHDGDRVFTAGPGDTVVLEAIGGFSFAVADLFRRNSGARD